MARDSSPSRACIAVLAGVLAIVPSVLAATAGQSPPGAAVTTSRSWRLTADATSDAAVQAESCTEKSILPAYFYPGPQWDAALASTTSSSTIIVNPDSGPGSSDNPTYVGVVDAARAYGAVLYGYIITDYASVPVTTVAAEVDDYRSWYGIENFYFDDASSTVTDLAYYRTISDDVRDTDPSASIVLNPGDYPSAQYATLGDSLVVFEGTYQSLLASTPPAWVQDHPASMFVTQVNNVPASTLGAALALAAADHTQYVYASPQTVSSTLYEQVPSYWTTELAAIDATCTAASSGTGQTAGGTTAAPTAGYRMAAADGGVFAFGDAAFYGSMGGKPVDQPIVGIAATPDGGGYWEVAADGGVFAFGDAAFYGSMGGKPVDQPIVGIAATPDGGGYWEVAADGGVFAFGDAAFYGSMGGKPVDQPIVGIAATPDGGGYWEVAADGGVFAFGDAAFYGSMGGKPVDQPIVGIAATPDGGGYWEVAADGGVFAFGDAAFYGSMGGKPVDQPIVGIAATPDGGGYWEVAADGGVFAFGDAAFYGSMGGRPLDAPMVGVG